MTMDILAVLLATVVGMGVGSLWYGPLLGEEWRKAAGVTREQVAQSNFKLLMAATLLLELTMAIFFELAARDDTVMHGVQLGCLAALFFALAMAVHYLFEHRPMRLYLINVGHTSLVFILMGAICGFLR
ncbi:DUF1761 domain-containing protein [Saccharospirillum mangrovi]|uniref:DUF1761 domain-containing protein n=2 Tax=Saccharospirillum mangrovi TaxID=2161747 RepID=UPI000D37D48A|nr:DUF1761 domain-containing protein [Saccharospirillum mangrovi]